MSKATASPGCSRFGMTESFVPFQPNANPDGTANPPPARTTRSSTARRQAGPGRAAAGHARVPDLLALLQRARRAVPGHAAPQGRRGRRSPAGTAALTCRRAGRSTPPKPLRGAISARRGDAVTFTVTPSAARAVNQNFKISAPLHDRGRATGYTDQVVRVVSPVEGRFQRWGNWAEYDEWLENDRSGGAPARPLGRDPVDGRRRDDHDSRSSSTTGPTTARAARSASTLPANVTADATSQAVRAARPGRGHDRQLHRLEHVTRTRRCRAPATRTRRRATSTSDHDDLLVARRQRVART